MDHHHQAAVEDQVDDLRERMRMLQGDRKANIDIMEANKAANRDEIQRLRDDNKDLRLKLSQLQRTGAEVADEGAELTALQAEVTRLRKVHDDCKTRSATLSRQLQALGDSAKDLQLEATQPGHEDTPLTRHIRILENRLDKAMIKYNEAQSIRKTYEQIVRRLKEERVGFDNQLGALERTIGAKAKDHEELMLLSGDANHAREVAVAELERVRAGYEEERRRRDAELRERQQVATLRRQMRDRADRRNKAEATIRAEECGEGEGGEAGLKSRAEADGGPSAGREAMEHRTRIDVFENAFRRIKEATGVSDVNEIIKKVVGQERTAESLLALTGENAARAEALQASLASLRARMEEIKYSGPGEAHWRKMVSEQEAQLSSSQARLEHLQTRHERLANMLVSAKAGVQHLGEKLRPVAEELGVEMESTKHTTMAAARGQNDARSVAELLLASERVLCEVAAFLQFLEQKQALARELGGDAPKVPLGTGRRDERRGEGAASGGEEGGGGALLRGFQSPARPYNQRIPLPSLVDGSDAGSASDGDDDAQDLDDEVTREKVKRAANAAVAQQEKRKKAHKKKQAPHKEAA
ncbi:hypothetical protein JKP88DRAFT_318591 [Tribonema minus]|uniref:ODAD1 central coiled coil region domain-containing protein n=1 Tax=Tribonema minus TaxID=303371 RepID=A0A836CG60_9STRA|nr:hypothetical protein JKP88DRAFT_318591 [Tribonema minus]